MEYDFVGLAAIEPRIRAYWQNRHGVSKPLNNDPKNIFLGRFMQQIADIIKLVDNTRAEGLRGQDLAEVQENLLESLRNFDKQLFEMEHQHFADKAFCALIASLKEHVDGARLHLEDLPPAEKKAFNPVSAYVRYTNGIVLDDSRPDDNPFYGSEKNEDGQIVNNMGICSGDVVCWGNNQPYNTREAFLQQNTTVKAISEERRVYASELAEILNDDNKLSSASHYTMMSLETEKEEGGIGHVIGIRQCANSDAFELREPNYGRFICQNKAKAIEVLQYIATLYYANKSISLKYVRIMKLPIQNKNGAKISTPAPIESSRKPEEDLQSLVLCTLSSIEIIATNITKADRYSYAENRAMIAPLLAFLEKNTATAELAETVKNLFESKSYYLVQFVSSLSERLSNDKENKTLQALLAILKDNSDPNEEINQENVLKKMFAELTKDIESDTELAKAFEQIPSSYQKKLLLECMINRNIDIKLYLRLFKKYENHPNVLEAITHSNPLDLFLSTLEKADLDRLIVISKQLYDKPELPTDINPIYRMLVIAKCYKKFPQDQRFEDVDFVKAMEFVIANTKEAISDQLIVEKAQLQLNINQANKFLDGNMHIPVTLALLIDNCENIISNSECTQAQRARWTFIKEFAAAIQTQHTNTVTSFLQQMQNMQLYMQYYDQCIRITRAYPEKSIIKLLAENLASNLSDLESCHRLYLMQQSFTHFSVDIPVLVNGLSSANQCYLVPILTSGAIVQSITDDQFRDFIERIITPLSAQGIATLDEALLNKNVIDRLSLKQIIILAECLTEKREKGYTLAGEFQYDEKVGFGEKCKEHSAFPIALGSLVKSMVPNKTRWSQITDELRKRADVLLAHDVNGKLDASVGSEISVLDDLKQSYRNQNNKYKLG